MKGMGESKQSGRFPSASFSHTVLNFVVNGEQMVGLCSPTTAPVVLQTMLPERRKHLLTTSDWKPIWLHKVKGLKEGHEYVMKMNLSFLHPHNFTDHTQSTHIFFSNT